MIVPFQQLSLDALHGLIEEFITREGTDYGEVEISLADKVEQVKSQLQSKDVVIVFDPVMETVTLLPRLEAEQRERQLQS